ncbi:hypothetical protein Hanom_Chr06g00529891 [Helianthus anomalus]
MFFFRSIWQYKLVTYRKLMNCVKDTRNRNISTNKLPLGAVDLAIWMSSVANHCKEGEGPNGEEDMKLCIMGVGDNRQR